MASVTKRDGKRGPTWKVVWRLPDGSQRAKSFKSKDAARAFRIEVEALEQAGRTPDPQKGAITLHAWSEEYLRTLHLKPKTRANYESLLRSQILPTFRDRTLSDLTRLDVQHWVAGMADELSASRTRSAYTLFSSMLREAVKHDRILKNPAEDVKLPKIDKGQVKPLTADELKRLAKECKHHEPFVLFLGMMGLRWAEAVGLRWGNVSDGYVTVERTLSEVEGRFHDVPTKTGEIRTLPIPQWLQDQMPPRRDAAALVFPTRYSNPMRTGSFRKTWTPAVQRAGLENLKVHHLRHTCASLLIQQGANPKIVQIWLGHKDIQVTMSVYAHLFPSDLDAIAAKIDTLIRS